MGVQCVLYFTAEGRNRFIGVPTAVAAALKAVKNAVYDHPDLFNAIATSSALAQPPSSQGNKVAACVADLCFDGR